MKKELDIAVRLCEVAEQALDDVEIKSAISAADRARRILSSYAEPREAAIFVRATAAQVDGLSLADDLPRAEIVAGTAVGWSRTYGAGGRALALAYFKLFETREMRHRYRTAGEGFYRLEQNLPAERWAAPLKMRCANHMLSVGVHNADLMIAERGIEAGARVRSIVTDPDEVSAWLQWRGLHESRRYQPEAAAATFAESFELRVPTLRRTITKRFLDAEIAFFGSDAAGVAVLSEAVEMARGAGLVRHARAATQHMSRYFI